MIVKNELIQHKSPVYVRFRTLSDGRKSAYLDIYQDGVRSYKTLNLYILPGTDAKTRRINAATLKQIEQLREEQIVENAYERAGLEDRSYKSDVTLVDWLTEYGKYVELKGCSKSACDNIKSLQRNVRNFNRKLMLHDIDGKTIDTFIEYLRSAKQKGTNKLYATNTIASRIRTLHSALNYAVREKLLGKNPCLDKETYIKETEITKEYLSIEEVEKLILTPCKKYLLKQAFMLSCFSGLRISDIRNLHWSNIVCDDGHWRIEIRQQKTKELLYLPLSRMARKWIPERGNASNDDKIFKGIGTSLKEDLKDWIEAAGITKKVTYHTSRHTFGMLAMAANVDIYTCSRLMGHTNVTTTMIYATIANAKKIDAVSRLDNILDK